MDCSAAGAHPLTTNAVPFPPPPPTHGAPCNLSTYHSAVGAVEGGRGGEGCLGGAGSQAAGPVAAAGPWESRRAFGGGCLLPCPAPWAPRRPNRACILPPWEPLDRQAGAALGMVDARWESWLASAQHEAPCPRPPSPRSLLLLPDRAGAAYTPLASHSQRVRESGRMATMQRVQLSKGAAPARAMTFSSRIAVRPAAAPAQRPAAPARAQRRLAAGDQRLGRGCGARGHRGHARRASGAAPGAAATVPPLAPAPTPASPH